MSQGLVLDPTVSSQADISESGPDGGSIAGKTIGFRVDQLWPSWDWISEIWADEFRKAGANVVFWRSAYRTPETDEQCTEELNAFLASIDMAIVGLGNCGSCTSWTIHDALAAARTGIPTTAVVTDNFADLGRMLASRGGRSGLRIHVLPYPLNERFKDNVQKVGREHVPLIAKTLGLQFAAQAAAA